MFLSSEIKRTGAPIYLSLIHISVAVGIGALTGATIFRAKDYSKLIEIKESNFEEDFKNISYDTVPRLNESTAYTLADQQLGSLSAYKSQYLVSADTNQINYKNRPVRVASVSYTHLQTN